MSKWTCLLFVWMFTLVDAPRAGRLHAVLPSRLAGARHVARNWLFGRVRDAVNAEPVVEAMKPVLPDSRSQVLDHAVAIPRRKGLAVRRDGQAAR